MGVIKRKNPSGKIVYGIQWFDEDGKRRREFNKSWTHKDAKHELRTIVQLQEVGVVSRSLMTVDDLFAIWHEDHVLLKRRAAWGQDSERQYRLRIAPMLGHLLVREVTSTDVDCAVAKMMRAGDGPATINKTLTALSGMFTHAVRHKVVACNVVHGVERPDEDTASKRTAWPLPVIQSIADAALARHDSLHRGHRRQRGEWAGLRDYTMIMLAAYTGVRQSELLALDWSCDEGDWLEVRKRLCRRGQTVGKTKSKRGNRSVPIIKEARELLDAWRKECPGETVMFPNSSGLGLGRMRANHFDQKVWDIAREAVGSQRLAGKTYVATDLTFHELRHTFASTCLIAGFSVWEVSVWLGDRPEVVERVYAHYIRGPRDTSRISAAFSAA